MLHIKSPVSSSYLGTPRLKGVCSLSQIDGEASERGGPAYVGSKIRAQNRLVPASQSTTEVEGLICEWLGSSNCGTSYCRNQRGAQCGGIC